MMKKIFLGGGGSEQDSVYLDKEFVSILEIDKPLIYIPVAMTTKSYEECNKWFHSVFSPLGVKRIEMCTDLQKIDERELDNVAGVYIGGGNAVKLLNEIRQSKFDKYLKDYINQGKPVYGGSAGAIILGADIRTTPEAQNLNKYDAKGLNVLFGYSVYAHYDPSHRDIRKIYKAHKHPIIAIPERSGAYIKDRTLIVVGFEPLYLTYGTKLTSLSPGDKFRL